MSDAAPALLTPKDVAARLQVSPWWVCYLARSGAIGSYRMGRLVRFSEEQLATYLANTRQNVRGARFLLRRSR